MQTTKIQITLEETRRVAMEFEATDEQLEMLYNGENPFEEEMMRELNSGSVEYDFAVCDMEGCTLVDWN